MIRKAQKNNSVIQLPEEKSCWTLKQTLYSYSDHRQYEITHQLQVNRLQIKATNILWGWKHLHLVPLRKYEKFSSELREKDKQETHKEHNWIRVWLWWKHSLIDKVFQLKKHRLKTTWENLISLGIKAQVDLRLFQGNTEARERPHLWNSKRQCRMLSLNHWGQIIDYEKSDN